MSLGYPASAILSALLIIGGVYLFSRLLPRRREYLARAALGGAAFIAGVLILEGLRRQIPDSQASVSAMALGTVISCAILALACALVIYCRDCDSWAALFCATAGFVIQSIALSFATLLANLAYGFYRTPPAGASLFFLGASTAIIYVTCLLSIARTIEERGVVGVSRRPMLWMTGMVVVVSIVLDLVGRELHIYAVPSLYIYALRIIQIVAGAFLLFVEYEFLYRRRLESDVVTIERIRTDEARQFQLSKENIESINMRFHDIRHQIRHLHDNVGKAPTGLVDKDLLADIAQKVRIYDASVKTGNEALDVLLTEKRLACEHEGIALSCIVDGEALSFMGATDLYAFLGNALDNAIGQTSAIADSEHRSISLNVSRRLGMVSVHVENYCADENGQARDPYGDRTARLVVEHYAGTLSTTTRDGIFHLNAVIPMPE